MSRTIRFAGDYGWPAQPSGRANRPYSEVKIFGPNFAAPQPILCVVDSGADYFQLPEELLQQAGYSPVGTKRVMDASLCNFSFNAYSQIEVEIEGHRVIVQDVLANPEVPALLGRNGFLTAIDVGFDGRGWLYRP